MQRDGVNWQRFDIRCPTTQKDSVYVMDEKVWAVWCKSCGRCHCIKELESLYNWAFAPPGISGYKGAVRRTEAGKDEWPPDYGRQVLR